jgi:hypothetical protein
MEESCESPLENGSLVQLLGKALKIEPNDKGSRLLTYGGHTRISKTEE